MRTNSSYLMGCHIIKVETIIRTTRAHHVRLRLLSLTMQRNVSHPEYQPEEEALRWFISKHDT